MKIKQIKREIFFGLAIFILLDILIISAYTNVNFNPGIRSALDYRLKDEININNTFIDNYRNFSNAIFNNIINKKNILKIVYDYDNADFEGKQQYRQQLYDSLQFVYKIIKYKNYNIFHFHDPQGNSLLRFHKPLKHGDNLLSFRKSIGIIIKNHHFIEGFEEGRIINSYRFIYPLFYNNKYVGSVEMSVSINSLLKEKEKSFAGKSIFYLKNNIYKKIVNKSTEKYYSNSDLKGYKIYNFLKNTGSGNQYISDSTLKKLNKQLQKEIDKTPLNNKPLIKWIQFENKNWLITFFPLLNFSGEQVALIVSYEIFKPIDSLLHGRRMAIIFATLLSFLIALIYVFVSWGRRQAVERQKILAAAKEKAEEMARLKSSFLANMSHEIRTPMNGVVGMTEILKQTDLNDDQKEFVSIIESSANALLNVINDILDFSKIDSNKIEIENISFPIRKVVEDIGDTLLILVEKKGIAMLTYIDPKIPNTLIGDPVRLRQVLLNLANNAVKFTNEGEVLVSAERVMENSNNDKVTVLFKVKDTGIGISEDTQKKLFDAFTQADATINRKYGGTGLGLTISKRLIELMGGELLLESEVGKGSVFYFQLSFDVGEDIDEEYFTDTEDLSRLRVLVIDDNESNRIIFKKYFSFWNIHSDEAANVDDAVEKVKTAINNHAPYNLIIVDFQMPGKSGFDFARILEKENLKRNTKLILFSSISDMIDIKTLSEHGFDSYLYKPIKYNPFRKIVFETINKQVGTKLKVSGITETKEEIALDADNLDIKILLAEDNLINQKVATVTLSKLGYANVDVANNGTEAVQMHLNNQYDLILMDIQMPVMNGLDATKKIREYEKANPGVKRVKIIALTANALESDVKMYLQEGLDNVLTKPFKRDDLKKILG